MPNHNQIVDVSEEQKQMMNRLFPSKPLKNTYCSAPIKFTKEQIADMVSILMDVKSHLAGIIKRTEPLTIDVGTDTDIQQRVTASRLYSKTDQLIKELQEKANE